MTSPTYEATGVRVVSPSGVERIYPTGRSWDTDGYGDYIIYDENGNKVASRRRTSVDEIEVIYAEV